MQAVLILAHKDFDEVMALCNVLKKCFKIYVHFDIKMTLTNEQTDFLRKNEISYIQQVSANWGGWGISEATILLMRLALKNSDIDYFHVVSGQDWPAKDVNLIYQFYENNNNIYMKYAKASELMKHGEQVILWQKYYYNYDKVNRRTTFGKIYHRVIIVLQTLFRINKFKKHHFDLVVYHGANWMDLSREAVEFCIDYFDHNPNVQAVFKTGYCSDEFVFQTILCNSKLANRIINDNHRYVKWVTQYGNYPAVLDENEYDAITKGNYHFIRKVDYSHSKILKEKLNV